MLTATCITGPSFSEDLAILRMSWVRTSKSNSENYISSCHFHRSGPLPHCTFLLDTAPSLIWLISPPYLASTQVHWSSSEQRKTKSHSGPFEGRACRDCGLWAAEEGSSAMRRVHSSQGDMPSWTRRLSAAEDWLHANSFRSNRHLL